MGCSKSIELASSKLKNSNNGNNNENSNNGIFKKETIDVIQDSWKKFNDKNTLVEHGLSMIVR